MQFTSRQLSACTSQSSQMKRNVIILTSGLTGSSVLTGLIVRAGYWVGNTHEKEDYNTYENTRLIELNRMLLSRAPHRANYLIEFSDAAVREIATLTKTIGTQPYGEFLEECNQHRPWLWKDPRLWMTIRFWQRILNVEECRFILLTRGYLQSWVSQTLRRQIKSYGYTKQYEQAVRRSIRTFLEEHRLPYLHISYENLIQRPREAINTLNRFLETNLTVDDLKAVYNKPLYRSPRRPLLDHAKAVLIYAKNYRQRIETTDS